MSALDLVIAIIVLIGLWRGYNKGFIHTFIGFFGWFIALVAGTRLADDVAPQMAGLVASPVLQSSLGFITVVLVVMVVVQIIAMFATKTIDLLKLGFLNKAAGGLLGAGKNLLIILVIFSFSAPILVAMPMWQASTIAPELLPLAPHAKQLVADILGDAWQQIDYS